ncbi:disease resistance protein L6-like [Cornus florida]|uniref:disease resistance protein L6-like n=1 Tax=Cornus florida TaxID=4283 RepID=UPI00289DADE2|nr:disease resistance protein L6-like [Cornus florida]
MVQQHNSLQKQLLVDTLELCPGIADVNSGIKKVLIVFDDVNESSQLASLLGKNDQFGSGSRIIVTTRDKHVLNALGVDGFYKPSRLNNVQSLQLLSIHAFRIIFPPEDYVSISKKIVSVTFGIPLALEVIGSFLSDKVLWIDTLKKLKNIPDFEVQKKLSISYEALNYEQQQIFLDIACFFVGMDKTYVSYMWDGCDYNPEKEINVLCLMSLVKIGDDNLLRMHHQLRDLGREIVRQESFKNPGYRSRLWNHKEALDILEGRRGTEKVEALSLHFELRPERKPRFTSGK